MAWIIIQLGVENLNDHFMIDSKVRIVSVS